MKFDILGVGNALVDETYYVSRNFVDSTGLPFNHFHPITHEQQEAKFYLPERIIQLKLCVVGRQPIVLPLLQIMGQLVGIFAN